MCKISIIVAVYNTQDYLIECLNSIKNQSFGDFEVLLINDGSTDSSGNICNDFAFNDNRFKVFHQVNMGISCVRNFGVLNACGDYIIHVDSDDFVAPHFLEALYNKIEDSQADVAFCDFVRFSESIRYEDTQKIKLNSEDIIIGILTGNHFGALWNKLIKRSILIENNIEINEKISWLEDVFVIISVLINTKKVVYVNEALYNYRFTPNSLSYTRNKKSFLSSFIVVEKISKILPKKDLIQNALIEFKLGIRRDILLFGREHNFPRIYPETNNFIAKSKVLTSFQKIALKLEDENLYVLLNLLLKTRLILKKMKG